LSHYAARGGLEALRYPSLLKASFKETHSVFERNGDRFA
jgi:hypothetical protein